MEIALIDRIIIGAAATAALTALSPPPAAIAPRPRALGIQRIHLSKLIREFNLGE